MISKTTKPSPYQCLELRWNHPNQKLAFMMKWTKLINEQHQQQKEDFGITVYTKDSSDTAQWVEFEKIYPSRQILSFQQAEVAPLAFKSLNPLIYFNHEETRGSLTQKNKKIEWDLKITVSKRSRLSLIHKFMQRLLFWKSPIEITQYAVFLNGTVYVNDEPFPLIKQKANLVETTGQERSTESLYLNCDEFYRPDGSQAQFGITSYVVEDRLAGILKNTKYRAFIIDYDNQRFTLNNIQDLLNVKTTSTRTSFEFSAHSGHYEFKGKASSSIKNFKQQVQENTNGQYYHLWKTPFCDLTIQAYYKGQLKETFFSPGLAELEFTSEKENPILKDLTQ